jgi:hypothetical protein
LITGRETLIQNQVEASSKSHTFRFDCFKFRFHSFILDTFSTLSAHRDGRHFDGQPSLSGHCGHGWTCSLPRPVARQPQDGTVKKGLHRPILSAIIPNLTAAGSHPDCRAVLIQIVALYRGRPK